MSPEPSPPQRRLRAYIETMPTGVHAFVMATGIISVGMELVNQHLISLALWVIAAVGWLWLTTLVVVRAFVATESVRRALKDPNQAFGFFTVIAATSVVGTRFAVGGILEVAIGLWILALCLWAVAGYAIPWGILVRPLPKDERQRAMFTTPEGGGRFLSDYIDGTWFVWVVATQSVAVLGATIQPHLDVFETVVAAITVVAWSTGLGLYVMVGTGLVQRIFRWGLNPTDLTPSYWVVMGALAISALASGRIMNMNSQTPVAAAAYSIASGVGVMLWGFTTWLVVGLLLMVVWKIWRRVAVKHYITPLWSMVFPMGVYSVASMTMGDGVDAPRILWAGYDFIWVALAAWVLVTVSWVVHMVGRVKESRAQQDVSA